MPKPTPLTPREKSYFDTIRSKSPETGSLQLTRMTLDGKDVAVILTPVFNRFTSKEEGLMPLAIIPDDDTIGRLRGLDGEGGAVMSPYDLDPSR